MNARNLFGMDCISHLLNFLSWSISLHVILIYRPFDPTNSPAWSSFCFHRILSFCPTVRDPPPFEHPHSAVSELEHNDTFDLGEVKLCWRVLIHFTISALQISGSFPISEGNGIPKILTVTVIYVTTTSFCKHYFKVCI